MEQSANYIYGLACDVMRDVREFPTGKGTGLLL